MLFGKFDKILAVFVFVIVSVLLVSAYTAGDQTKPWHSLQQTSTNGASFSSVDSDANGFIDLADAAVKIKCPDGTFKESKDCGFGSGSVTPGTSCAPEYDSGWFLIYLGGWNGKPNVVSKAHGLGVTPQRVVILDSATSAGTTITNVNGYGHYDSREGPSWYQDASNIYVIPGEDTAASNGSTHPITVTTLFPSKATSAYYRVLAWKDYSCGSTGGSSLPDCAANQYIKRNSTDTAWECVNTVFQNQISGVAASNWTYTPPTSNTTNINCDNITTANLTKLSDGDFTTRGIHCFDTESYNTASRVTSLVLDMGKQVRNGLVYLYFETRGTNTAPGYFVKVYSSVDGLEYTLVAADQAGSNTLSEASISGIFSGRYLKINTNGSSDTGENGDPNTNTQGESYINEIQVFSFTP